MMLRLIAGLLVLAAVPAAAQSVEPCDWRARADAIPEPWEDNTKVFANGAVRVALLDVIEPAAGAFYLLILHPPVLDMGERHCTLIGFSENIGYAGIFFDDLETSYDPARGLTISVPGMLYLPEEGFSNSLILHATVNQATGAVTAVHELGSE